MDNIGKTWQNRSPLFSSAYSLSGEQHWRNAL
jgi:hypothetical protein